MGHIKEPIDVDLVVEKTNYSEEEIRELEAFFKKKREKNQATIKQLEEQMKEKELI